MPKGMSDVAMLSIDKAFIVGKEISSIEVSLVFDVQNEGHTLQSIIKWNM